MRAIAPDYASREVSGCRVLALTEGWWTGGTLTPHFSKAGNFVLRTLRKRQAQLRVQFYIGRSVGPAQL